MNEKVAITIINWTVLLECLILAVFAAWKVRCAITHSYTSVVACIHEHNSMIGLQQLHQSSPPLPITVATIASPPIASRSIHNNSAAATAMGKESRYRVSPGGSRVGSSPPPSVGSGIIIGTPPSASTVAAAGSPYGRLMVDTAITSNDTVFSPSHATSTTVVTTEVPTTASAMSSPAHQQPATRSVRIRSVVSVAPLPSTSQQPLQNAVGGTSDAMITVSGVPESYGCLRILMMTLSRLRSSIMFNVGIAAFISSTCMAAQLVLRVVVSPSRTLGHDWLASLLYSASCLVGWYGAKFYVYYFIQIVVAKAQLSRSSRASSARLFRRIRPAFIALWFLAPVTTMCMLLINIWPEHQLQLTIAFFLSQGVQVACTGLLLIDMSRRVIALFVAATTSGRLVRPGSTSHAPSHDYAQSIIRRLSELSRISTVVFVGIFPISSVVLAMWPWALSRLSYFQPSVSMVCQAMLASFLWSLDPSDSTHVACSDKAARGSIGNSMASASGGSGGGGSYGRDSPHSRNHRSAPLGPSSVVASLIGSTNISSNPPLPSVAAPSSATLAVGGTVVIGGHILVSNQSPKATVLSSGNNSNNNSGITSASSSPVAAKKRTAAASSRYIIVEQ
jgi:uncharacterized membrane protein YgcG